MNMKNYLTDIAKELDESKSLSKPPGTRKGLTPKPAKIEEPLHIPGYGVVNAKVLHLLPKDLADQARPTSLYKEDLTEAAAAVTLFNKITKRRVSVPSNMVDKYPAADGWIKFKATRYIRDVQEGLEVPTMEPHKLAELHGVSMDAIITQLTKGIKVEMEHTTDKDTAREIALDHIKEDPKYYDKLEKAELE